jgi:ABC-2 type transport system ATP-binding protein
VPRRARKQRSQELLELVGLKDWQEKKVKGYSKGMRQRLGIANSLMNDPDLVVLDEPTDGVDPVGRRDIRNVLLHLKERGKTVFLNSHLLSELEMVCDEVAILVQGVVSAHGTMDELTKDSRRYEIEIAVPDALGEHAGDELFLPEALSGVALLESAPAESGTRLNHAPGAGGARVMEAVDTAMIKGTLAPTARGEEPIPITVGRSSLSVGTDDAAKIQPLIDALRAKGCVIRAVRPVRSSLEDLFMKAVMDPLTGQALAPGALKNPRRGFFGRKGGAA